MCSIINMVHVDFVCQLFNLPLKTEESPHRPFTEKQMYDILALLFGCVFLDKDEVQSFKIRKLSAEANEAISTFIKLNVKEVSLGGWVKKLADGIKKDGFLDAYGNSLIRRFLDEGMSFEEVVWVILPTAVAAAANQGQQVFSIPPTIFLTNGSPLKCLICILLTSTVITGLRLCDCLISTMRRP